MNVHCVLLILTTTVSSAFDELNHQNRHHQHSYYSDKIGLSQPHITFRHSSSSSSQLSSSSSPSSSPSSSSSYSPSSSPITYPSHVSSHEHFHTYLEPISASSSSVPVPHKTVFTLTPSISSSSFQRRYWNPNFPSHHHPLHQPHPHSHRGMGLIGHRTRGEAHRHHRNLNPNSYSALPIDARETTTHELRVPSSSAVFVPQSASTSNNRLGLPLNELIELSSVPKMLKRVKNGFQSIPGVKFFLLTKNVPKANLKPQIIVNTDEDTQLQYPVVSDSGTRALWNILNSSSPKKKRTKADKSMKFLPLTSPLMQTSVPSPSPPSPSPSLPSTSSSYIKKYVMNAFRSGAIELPLTSDLLTSSDVALYGPDLELAQGNGHSADEFGESQENHLSAVNSYLEPSFASSILRSMSTPIVSLPSSSSVVVDQMKMMKKNKMMIKKNQALQQQPQLLAKQQQQEQQQRGDGKDEDQFEGDEDTSDTRSIDSDDLRATSSIAGSSFMSPFIQNSHLPSHPAHNGWIPKNTKQWSPGTYRSAFYTPDTRLIKFTIKDRVNGMNGIKKLNKKRPQHKQNSVNTRDNTLLNSDGSDIKVSSKQDESTVTFSPPVSTIDAAASSSSSSSSPSPSPSSSPSLPTPSP
ncbi:uncharacterized protein LOC141850546 [Brevipalpus obovatus]|uniref:uncharacterized protein LOC141850546 n=1 Tax=Brevipalpus obovatus TaxID=246614 RepID=UPI003D9E20CB